MMKNSHFDCIFNVILSLLKTLSAGGETRHDAGEGMTAV